MCYTDYPSYQAAQNLKSCCSSLLLCFFDQALAKKVAGYQFSRPHPRSCTVSRDTV